MGAFREYVTALPEIPRLDPHYILRVGTSVEGRIIALFRFGLLAWIATAFVSRWLNRHCIEHGERTASHQ